MNRRKLLICGHPRSGTHLVQYALCDSGRRRIMFGELLAEKYWGGAGRLHEREQMEQAVTSVLQKVRRQGIGFMVQDYQYRFTWPGLHDEIVRQVRDPKEFVVLWLYRRDRFAAAVSVHHARATGIWVKTGTRSPRQARRLAVPATELAASCLDWCEQRRAAHAALSRFDSITLAYEDLVDRFDDCMALIQEALGLEISRVKPKTRRTTTKPLDKLVVGYTEVLVAFETLIGDHQVEPPEHGFERSRRAFDEAVAAGRWFGD